MLRIRPSVILREGKNKGVSMQIKRAVGRPNKVDYRVIIKLADSIQHNSTVTEACRYSGLSRTSYYHYLNTNPVFAEKMATAKDNQNKAVFSFLTIR